MWLDKKVVQDHLIIKKVITYIKGALIIILKDLKEQVEDQRSKRYILILVNKVIIYRLTKQRFKLKDKDKLRVNLWY